MVVSLRVLLGLVVLAVCGCAAGSDPPRLRNPFPEEQQVVSVARRDLQQVTAVDGTAVSRPEYVVSAPAAGEVKIMVAVGVPVEAEHVVAIVGGQRLRAPTRGVVQRVSRSTKAVPNEPLVVIAHGGFGVRGDVSGAQMFALYARPATGAAAISGGGAGYPCVVRPAATTTMLVNPQQPAEPPARDGAQPASAPAVCLLPDNAQAFDGATAKLGILAGERKNVLALPRTAVNGDADRGQVLRIAPDGTTQLRTVTLGVVSATHIEITDGLNDGDRVAAIAPGFP